MSEPLVNTYTIIMRTLPLVGEPPSRYNALKDVLLPHLNFGYLRWCDEYGKPSVWEQVTLDAEKQFDPKELSYPYKKNGVRKVSPYKDGSAEAGGKFHNGYDFRYVDGKVVVPYAEAGATVWVWYYRRPEELTLAESAADTAETTIPSLMDPEYRESLKFYVAAMYYRTERNQPERSRYWEERFVEAASTLEPDKNASENKFRNKYPAQPW